MPKKRKWIDRLFGKGDDSSDDIAHQESEMSAPGQISTQYLEVEDAKSKLSKAERSPVALDVIEQIDAVTPQEAEADVPAIWRVGDTILDLYEVTDVHGQGGMGLVYMVHHKGWNVDLAVKSPRPEIFAKAGGKENFVREAETWVNLGLHPHTVSCYYVRTLGGIPRVFAEYVEGGSLSDWIRRGKLYEGDEKEVLERILDIAIQIAWGLDYAHEQGLVHQDVKPANVLMTPEGIAKVTDFGLSRARAMAGEAELPESEQSILVSRGGMTPAYCSPEQAAGKPLNRKTDIWSWGLSFLEMFTGEVTWLSGQAALEALESYLDIEPKNISIPLMPTELEELLRHCFQYEPTERPTTINEVASKLVKIYREIIGVSHPRVIPKPMKDLADNLNNRALSLLDLGEQEKAKRLWEEALQTDPHHLHSTYNQGLHLWRTGHITDNVLIQRLEVARSSNKRDWLDKYMLGLVHLERGDIEVATPLFDEILKQAPDIRVVHEASNLAHSDQIASGCYLRTFKVHSQLPAIMRSVNLSADGRYGISGSTDHILRLWETANGRCLRTFEGHTGEVNSVYLSHDCRYALSGSKDNTLRYWKIANGRCLRTFKGHTDEVFSVCLSVDGRKALSGSNDGTMKLWQVSNGRCIRTFKGHTQRVLAVSISADGQYSLSGSFDKTLRLWETKTGRCLRIFEGHTGGVTSVCLSPDSRLALSGSADDTLRLWDVKTGHCLRVFKGHTGGVLSVSLSSDNLYALSSSFDFKIRFWETTAGRCLRTFEGHPNVLGLVFSVSMSSDGRFAMSGGGDQTIRFWRMPYGNVHTCTWILSKPQIQTIAQRYENRVNHLLSDLDKELDKENYVLALEIARKARAVPGYERAPQCLVAWDRLMHHCRRLGIRTTWRGLTFTGHKHYVASVFLSQNGRYALSGSRDNSLKLWEVSSGRCLRTFIGHTNWVIRLFLSADRRYILSCSYDCMKLWDVASGRCLQTFKEDTLEFFSVYLTTDCRYALSAPGRSGYTPMLWDVASGRCLRKFEGHTWIVNSVVLSADERYALSGSGDKTLKLWEVVSGRCVRTLKGHTDDVRSVCLSADGSYALSGSRDKTIKLWNLANNECLQTFVGHTGAIGSVNFSPDGRYVLSSSWDRKSLRLWEIASGRCLKNIEGYMGYVDTTTLSDDGRFVLSMNEKDLILWNLDWELDAKKTVNWDEGARPYLQNFLTLHTPYTISLPQDHQPSEEEVTLALTRQGKPTWTEDDFQGLIRQLQCAGYGWLRPEGVRSELEKMAKDWQGPPPLPGT